MIEQPQFDVFLAYDDLHEAQVIAIAKQLRLHNLNPWVKAEQMRPGSLSQDELQKAMQSINCAAIFLGSGELLKNQLLVLEVLISRLAEADKTLIPVLLPGVDEIPENLPFLKQIHYVCFANGINDSKAVEDLVWGITHHKSKPLVKKHFDVLLCYNNEDKNQVQQIANHLKQRQVRPWLDLWEVCPGNRIHEVLLKDIVRIKSVAFLIGSQGCPWQKEPLVSCLEEIFERNLRLIPVILQNVLQEPQLPIYLSRKIRVDFRWDEPDPIEQLIWAICDLNK